MLTPALGLLALGSVSAQEPGPPPREPAPPLDTASLAGGPYSRMEMLLEKTLFRVNVLTLEVRFGAETAAALRRWAESRAPISIVQDSMAATAARSTDAYARIEFRRGIGLPRFVDAVRTNMRRAREAGYLSADEYDRIAGSLPRWFRFLEARKIRRGDELLYRIHGDTLRTIYRSFDGSVLLDQTDVGPERRLAVLGSYFAPGSDFREGLLRSVLAFQGGPR